MRTSHPIACSLFLGFLNGHLDPFEVPFKVHGPLVQVAGGQRGQPARHGVWVALHVMSTQMLANSIDQISGTESRVSSLITL